MRRRTKLYRPIFLVLLTALAAVSLTSFFFDSRVFYITAAISVAAAVCALLLLLFARAETDRYIRSMGEAIGAMQDDALLDFPIPAVAVSDGEIIWCNDRCAAQVFRGENWYGVSASRLLGDADEGDGRFSIAFGGQEYTVLASRAKRAAQPVTVYYLLQDTQLKHDAAQYWKSRPAVLAIMIDSLDEFLQDARENERSQMLSQIELQIERFVGEHDGMVIKTDRDKFFAVIEERHMEGIIGRRFSLLDDVRALSFGDRMSATLSIGVARNVESYLTGERAARQALDMAQGRGGDQAAVKTQNGYDFYGGMSKGIEKRTKVKTRIVATALAELIDSSSNVIIMGHKFADLDCLGAAVGLLRPIRQRGKAAAVAISRSRNLVGQLMERLEQHGYDHSFFDPDELMGRITPDTLLIVVDTHLRHVLESEELFDACKTVAVIDHHRRMVGYIDNAVIFYHEPYASSTAEMVTELVQYFGEKNQITRIEAEALLAGIMLDTKNFVIRTGVRTFEAAAYLRRQGADTTEVRRMFSSTMESYQRRTRMVASAEVYHRCAIAISPSMTEDIKVVAPQAADELLGISDVDASFVLYEYDGGINISARSMGKINVQVIMEALGGGGHQTMAATQMPELSMEDARQKLLEAIEEYASYNQKDRQAGG